MTDRPAQKGVVIRRYEDWTRESYAALVAANEAADEAYELWHKKNICPSCGGLIYEDGSHREY